MSNNSYKLSVRKGPQEGETFLLVATTVTIGRDPMADIVINDPEVSRQHARLTRTDGGYEIQDLGSTNGTFLDGRRLGGEPEQLTPGQLITMGSNVSLVFEPAGGEMATVIAAEDESPPPDETEGEGESDDALPELEEDAYGTVLEDLPDDVVEADVVEPEPMRYEAVEEEFELPTFEEDEEPFSALEDEKFPSFAEAEDELPSFEEGAPPPDSETVFEAEPVAADYDEGETEEAAEDELPSFDTGEEYLYTPERESVSPPPPAVPPGAPPPGSNRNRNIVIAVLALLVICCCCLLALYLGYAYLGDILGCTFIDGYPNC